MKPPSTKTLLPLGLALLLACGALTGSAFAQSTDEKKPSAPPAEEKTATESEPEKAKVETKIAEPVDTVATKLKEAAEKIETEFGEAAAKLEEKAAADEAEMRRLDGEDSGQKPARKGRSRTRNHGTSSGDPKFGDQTVAAEKRQGEAVTIMGDTVVDGEVMDAAVSILGNTTVNGRVHDAAVSVLGTTTVNGRVGDAAVAVLGDIVLGPEAVVDGEVVVVFGKLKRAPGSQVKGGIQEIGGFGPFQGSAWLHAYVKQCVIWFRPLWFGENLGWAWLVAAGFLVFYLFLTLIFPGGVARCAEILEQQPGNTIVATLLTTMLTPLAMILLAITGVGLALVPFLAGALFFAGLFGKAAVLCWLGRRIVGQPGAGALARSTLLAVLLGGLIVMLLYCIPVMGFLLYKVFGLLGTGMVVYAVAIAARKDKPAKAPAPVLATHAAMPAASAGFTGATAEPSLTAPAPVTGGSPFTAPAAPPVLISADTLPRAGFWVRTGAAFLDFLLIGISCGILSNFINLNMPGFLFLALATYSAVMWRNKGTTIGGVICGLKVVRLDDRPIDWTIAIVRALSAFLSFFAAGMGFIWVAFDDEKQSWHDKIAGTTIVRVPKGTSLL